MKSLFENYVFFKNQASSFILYPYCIKLFTLKVPCYGHIDAVIIHTVGASHSNLKKSHGISFSFSVPFILIKIITI